MDRFGVGDVVRHFKGNKYKIIAIAMNTETEQLEVVYESMDSNHEVWARPYDMFIGKVDKNKYPDCEQEYRFEVV